jgi:G:T-mismatch repair DNA endonuclease (very short patch repair protein)
LAKKKVKMRTVRKKMNGTSKLEVAFAGILNELGIKYEQHFVFKKREFDFLLPDHGIIIETHGCFYHCCKTHNPEAKYTFQRNNLKNDQYKVKLVKFDHNYTLLIIWEHEMKEGDILVEKVNKFIDKHSKLLND